MRLEMTDGNISLLARTAPDCSEQGLGECPANVATISGSFSRYADIVGGSIYL